MEAWQPARVIDRGFRRTAQADAGKDDFVRNKFNQTQPQAKNRLDDMDSQSCSSARRSTYSRNHDHCFEDVNIQYPKTQSRGERSTNGHPERVPTKASGAQGHPELASPLERLRQILFRRGPRIAIALKRQLQVDPRVI